MLTKRQKQILDYIKEYIKGNEYAPTLEEMKRHFRLSSIATIHQHIETLRERGYLKKVENQPRSIELNRKRDSDLIDVPLVGTIAAGEPIEAIEDSETIKVPKSQLSKSGEHYALRVRGDSMIDEGIFDGDMVVIRKQPDAENGETVVALINGNEVTLKKIYKEKNRFRLQPANPSIKPIFTKELIVQGKVISVIRTFEELKEKAAFKNNIKLRKNKNKFLQINKLYQGDCFELINKIEDESVDLIVCDGPYGVTNNEWDKIKNIQKFNLNLIKLFARVLKKGGALYLFGKSNCIDFIDYRPYLTLNSKIIWYQPSRLAQGRAHYTNNYDIIAHFTKGKPKTFNLDDIRIPQLVELEHRKRVENVPSVVNGKFHKTRFNSNGKNPGDVWGDIKQLTYKSKELLSRDFLNTIQKPIKLIERIVKASSNEGDLVLDPFAGVGTTFVVCKKLKRDFIGFEINLDFVVVCNKRIKEVQREQEQHRLF